MIAVYLLISIAISIYVVKRTGYMSPSSVACIFSVASMLLFIWIGLLGGYQYNLGGLSFVPSDYSDVGERVMLVYTIYVALVGLSTLGLDREATKDPRAIEAAKTIIKSVLDSDRVVVCAIGLAFLCLCNNYLIYGIGDLGNPLVKLFMKGAGVICILAIVIVIYCWTSRRPLAVLIALFTFFGEFQFLLREYSRWCPLVAGLVVVLMAGRRKNAGKSVISLGTIAMSIVTLDLFLFDLQFKRFRSEFPSLDIVLPQLFQIRIDVQPLAAIMINFLQGPMVLAEALRVSGCHYVTKYMVLSFSPLISAIDHFSAIIRTDQYRVNANTPFNNFAEIYYFTWPFKLFYAAAIVVCMRQLTKIYMKFGPLYGLLLVAPVFYSLLAMHQYPIRSSFRLLIYPFFLSTFVSARLDRILLTRARFLRADLRRSRMIEERERRLAQAASQALDHAASE